MNYSKNQSSIINTLWWILKIAYGLFIIVVGVDKFFWLITPWHKYVSALILHTLGVNVNTLLYAVGGIEIVVGFMILTKWTRIGCYLALAWILIVVINLLAMGRLYIDIAARDILIAIGIYTLLRLTDLHERAFPEKPS